MTTNVSLRIPRSDGSIEVYRFREPPQWDAPVDPPKSRTAYAAVHVVADPLADNTPGGRGGLDWDATLAVRRRMWSFGLGVAEAMDTAQRGMGLTWELASELIRRSAEEASACNGLLACGVATDSAPVRATDLSEVLDAYLRQLELVEKVGAIPVIMASPDLVHIARGPDDYALVYSKLLEQTSRPAILHWLGEAFASELAGYWGSTDQAEATQYLLDIVWSYQQRIDGVKLSLLDQDHETAFRHALPNGITVYTGDDFHYPALILGDDKGGSDALLGIFDAIAPVASTALRALDAGDKERYMALLETTLPLARHIFSAPTYYYKTGIVFIAWLAGHQDTFAMLHGLHSARSLVHLVECARLADQVGLLPDPELAASRLSALLSMHGVV